MIHNDKVLILYLNEAHRTLMDGDLEALGYVSQYCFCFWNSQATVVSGKKGIELFMKNTSEQLRNGAKGQVGHDTEIVEAHLTIRGHARFIANGTAVRDSISNLGDYHQTYLFVRVW